MKKGLVVFTVLFALTVFISCQKEIDWGTGDTPTVTDPLIRIKSKTGTTDSAQVDFTYDAAGRLVNEKTTGETAGTSIDNELIIRRNSAGIITTTVQKSPALVTAGIDSIVTTYYYSSSRYTAAVFSLGIPGFAVKDSAVYSYDASGRISKDEHYTNVSGLPIPLPPLLTVRNIYTYSPDGKNLAAVGTEAMIPPSTSLAPAAAQTYTMDTKQNPLVLLNEAIVLNRTAYYGANNATKNVVTNVADPSLDFTMDYSYIYNSKNKPDSAYGTRTPGGAVTASKYFYQ